jgi:hypothetical protein
MNGRIIFLCLTLFLFFSACVKKGRVPPEMIQQEKMGVVLFEIAMAEGYIESLYSRDSTVNKDSMLPVEMDKVLAIHKITQKDFRNSYLFYKSNPDIFKVMTDTVYQRSQRNKDKMYSNDILQRDKEKK